MDIIYNAICLRPESQRSILREWPPAHPQIYCHHITLNHGVNELPDNLGEIVECSVVGYRCDDGIQVAVVDCDLSDNQVPHITISIAENMRSHLSNVILEQSGFEEVKPFKVKGQVRSFTEKGWITTLNSIINS